MLKSIKKFFKKLLRTRKKKGRVNSVKLNSNLKNFLIGAFIALIPVSVYGYLRLYNEGVGSLLASERENSQYENRMALLQVEYESLPTATPIPTKSPLPSPIPTKPPIKLTASIEVHRVIAPAEVQALIERYAGIYGVSKDVMTIIAKCESGFRANAVSGPYAGIYQFIASTWSSNRRAMGLDPYPELRFNAEEAVKTAAFKMSRDGYGAWPACSRKAFSQLGLVN